MRKSESYRSNCKEHIIDFAKLQGERWGEVVSGKASVRSQELGVGGRVLSSAFVVRSSKLGVREQGDTALRAVDCDRCVASSFHMTRSPPRRVRFFSVHLHSGYVKAGSVSIKKTDPEGSHVICGENAQSGIHTWLIAESLQGLFPTARVNVQHSSNFTGSVLLPATTAPV